MKRVRQVLRRLANLVTGRRQEDRLREEIEEHIALQTEENMRAGLPPVEARRQALTKFGAVEPVKEAYRDQESIPFVENLLCDLRYGLRILRKSPGFTAVAVVTLALGVGANTAVFSVARAIWLNPLPFTNSSSLVLGGEQWPQGGSWSVGAAIVSAWQQRAHSFSGMAAYVERASTLTGIGGPERLTVARVSHGIFDLLTVKPLAGRLWTPEETQARQAVALISYAQWQNHFGGDPGILGRGIVVDGKPVTIIGIMPQRFNFPPGDDLWMPLDFTPNDWADPSGHRFHVLARLQSGTSLIKANAELAAISKQLAKQYPAVYENRIGRVFPIRDYLNGNLTPIFVKILFAAAALVLLIACVNLSSLQLARATIRRREFAMRAALGGGRWRLVRQWITESVLLAASGATLGLLLATWADRVMVRTLPPVIGSQIAGWENIRVDGVVFAVAAGLATLAALGAATAPAIRARKLAPAEALKGATSSESAGPQHLRAVLVATEAAMALVLVVATLLVVNGFRSITTSVRHFESKDLITAHVDLPSAAYSRPEQKSAFIEEALSQLRSMPGVSSAFVFTSAPFGNNGVDWEHFTVSGKSQPDYAPSAIVETVSPGFFSGMRLPLISGRDFNESDGPQNLLVAIVSQNLARRWWPNDSALDKTIQLQRGGVATAVTIVGIAPGAEYDWTNNAPEAVIYLPYQQAPPASSYLAVRSTVPSASLVPEIRARFSAVDRDLPVDILSLSTVIWYALSGIAEVGGLLAGFGVIALVLGSVGVYGMVTYNVGQRTRETAIRMAVGAKPEQVLYLMLRQSMKVVAFGIACGIVGALLMGRVAGSFFFGTNGVDALLLVAAVLMLAAIALLASYIPSRRATKVDPMVALRCE